MFFQNIVNCYHFHPLVYTEGSRMTVMKIRPHILHIYHIWPFLSLVRLISLVLPWVFTNHCLKGFACAQYNINKINDHIKILVNLYLLNIFSENNPDDRN
jgi:hypothetical protein